MVLADALQFEDAGIHPIMLRNVKLCGYDVCTPVQAYCLPAIFKGYDVCASAHTGKLFQSHIRKPSEIDT